METTLSPQEIRENLAQFHGTENFYKHPLCNVIWTDGAQYVMDSCNAHWLVSDVSIQCDALKEKSEFSCHARMRKALWNTRTATESYCTYTNIATPISLWT